MSQLKSIKAIQRAEVLELCMQNKLSYKEAAFQLGVSYRQFIRLKKTYLSVGIQGLLHKNIGKKPWNKISNETHDQIRRLLMDKYGTLSLLQTYKILRDSYNLQISYSTLKRIKKNCC